MRAHGRIHAAGNIEPLRVCHVAIQILAHAVQSLELKLPVPGIMMNITDGMGVMSSELRVNTRAMRQQVTGAGQVGYIGITFQGEHRVVCQSLLLGTLDLHVPVGALDQAYRDDAVLRIGQLAQAFQQGQGAFLVRLYCNAQSRPGAQPVMEKQAFKYSYAHLQPFRLLRIDGQRNPRGVGGSAQTQHTCGQLTDCAVCLVRFKTGAKRGQFD